MATINRGNLFRGVLALGFVLFMGTVMFSSTSDSGGWLLVTNKGDQTLSIVDSASGRQVATVPVGGVTGHEVAASPDGRTAWVPIYGNSGVGRPGSNGRTVTVIDLQSRKVAATMDLGRETRPHCAVFGPKNGLLYVTAELTNSIDVINPSTRAIVASVPTGEPESHMLAISSDGKRGYTSNVGAGTVSAIDLQNKKVLAVIPVAKVAQRIAISTDNRWIFTADQIMSRLAVINTGTNKLESWVPLPDIAYGTAPTRDGRWLLITQPRSAKVSVLDLKTMKIDHLIDVPSAPQEVLVRPDGKVAYVSCDRSKQVAAIDLSTWKVEKLIDVGAGADGLAWAAAQH